MRSARSRAFTLAELLVSLTVSVGLVAAAYLCLHGGLRTRGVVEERMDLAQKARVALSLITADIRAACVYVRNASFIGMARSLGPMEADNIDFATHHWTPRGPGEGDVCEVSWYVDRNPRTGAFGLWRRTDPAMDDNPLDGGAREEIVEEIAGLRLEYSDGLSWYDSWGEQRGMDYERSRTFSLQDPLPEAVRVTLVFRAPGEESPAPGGATLSPASKDRASSRSREPGARKPGREPPGRSSSRDSGAGSAPEGYVLFQAVARIELAQRAARQEFAATATSGSESSSASGTPGADPSSDNSGGK